MKDVRNKSQRKLKDSNSTPLSGYKQNKKTLTPPLATIPNMILSSWINDRLPEMLWAALIRNHHPGNTGYAIFRSNLRWLGDNIKDGDITGICHSDIANMSDDLRKQFIERIVVDASTEALRPLLLLPELPAYDDWKEALGSSTGTPEKDWEQLAASVQLVLWHQSQEATDVRWVKLVGTILTGKINFFSGLSSRLDEINNYPNRGDQRSVRPSIRSMEMMGNMTEDAPEWPAKFWRYVYENTRCFPEIGWREEDAVKRMDGVTKDKEFYGRQLERLRQDLLNHYMATSETTSMDARHESVFGLAIYALDTFIENCILETAGTVSGRATARIIFEAYVTLAYLVSKEARGEPAWDGYRNYGAGQINLIHKKYSDESYDSAMVDITVIDKLANEDKWSEYVPINVGNWDESDLRKICIALGKKDVYDKYYPYTSGYLHASWGSVREASFQTCYNPLHRLHRIPSYGLPILPNVNEDCRQLLNEIFKLVNKTYPGFKHTLRKRPVRIKENKAHK